MGPRRRLVVVLEPSGSGAFLAQFRVHVHSAIRVHAPPAAHLTKQWVNVPPFKARSHGVESQAAGLAKVFIAITCTVQEQEPATTRLRASGHGYHGHHRRRLDGIGAGGGSGGVTARNGGLVAMVRCLRCRLRARHADLLRPKTSANASHAPIMAGPRLVSPMTTMSSAGVQVRLLIQPRRFQRLVQVHPRRHGIFHKRPRAPVGHAPTGY